MQEIDGNGVDAEIAQRQGHVNDVIMGFPHANNAAAARIQARFLDVVQGFHAVCVGMRGYNMRCVCFAGIEVVIDAIDARVF